MALQVIGAGWSRTGTFSLRLALQQLGLGPCYHMHDVFEHPEHVALWRQAAAGQLADWAALLAGYVSVADSPPCLFWRELLARYPDAKVILTVRDAEQWYDSMRSTVVEAMSAPERAARGDATARAALELARELVLEGFFQGRFSDRSWAIARFREHNRAVQAEVPRERLLVFEVREGWGPLCAFLGKAVPDAPFPQTNAREQFRARANING
jgi:hypothetical protein